MARRPAMEKSKGSKEMLQALLKELHLPAFRAGYEEMARQAQAEGLSFQQYLLGLAQRECQERRNKRVERLLHDSRLPLEKRWQTLDLKGLPPKVVQLAPTLLEGSFLDRHENVLAFGGGRANPSQRNTPLVTEVSRRPGAGTRGAAARWRAPARAHRGGQPGRRRDAPGSA